MQLPHPKTGNKFALLYLTTLGTRAQYIFHCGSILEIQRYIDDPASWFIDNSVQKGIAFLLSCADVG
jgi:hypothetical protein